MLRVEVTGLGGASANCSLAKHVSGMMQTLLLLRADLGFEDLGGPLAPHNGGQR